MSWKRLESATVDPNIAEGLEARIADPLWMLARQWQTGEFKGDDAANPLLVSLEARSVRIERLVLPGGRTIELDEVETPLEPLVEREPVRDGPSSPRVAAELGRLLVRSLQRVGVPKAFLIELQSRYPLDLPLDDGLDPTGRRRLELLARRTIDGLRLASAIAAIKAMHEGLLPPTIGLQSPDPECDLDYVPNKPRKAETKVVLVNGFGFGGQNGCVVLEKWQGE